MSYYKILGLEREPFSTSPDPAFFYQSKGHKSALYRLQVAIRLKRGLSLILGDIGTGKTTLARRLAQILSKQEDVFFRMILNPIYESEKQFLFDLSELFHIELPKAKEAGANREMTVLEYMKLIERFLFQKGVEERQTIVLLIDEAQKLSEPCLEILRTLLNYETNEYKILQLILMSQMELLPVISRIKNLWDRIALKYVINALEEEETKEMINFRLRQAGYVSRYSLFTEDAISLIYQHTQGYPRKVAILCHDALEDLVRYNREVVNREIVESIIAREVKPVEV